jgi:hypothetical protein
MEKGRPDFPTEIKALFYGRYQCRFTPHNPEVSQKTAKTPRGMHHGRTAAAKIP